MVRIASTPYKPSKIIQLISFDLKISNPSKNTITKAIDIEPTSPEKHFAFILKLKILKTDKAINTKKIRLLSTKATSNVLIYHK